MNFLYILDSLCLRCNIYEYICLFICVWLIRKVERDVSNITYLKIGIGYVVQNFFKRCAAIGDVILLQIYKTWNRRTKISIIMQAVNVVTEAEMWSIMTTVTESMNEYYLWRRSRQRDKRRILWVSYMNELHPAHSHTDLQLAHKDYEISVFTCLFFQLFL